jgi:hypothetical protein
VSWSLASGSLPPGVVLDAATGTIAGVPTVPGSFAALVQGRDTWNSSRVATAAIGITVAPVNISVSTTALPGGTVRAWYQSALVASGGSGSTLWSVAAGALPPGLVLNSDGLITGTPTALGSFTFTARATDAAWPTNTATRPLTIAIASRDIVLYAADASAIHGAWTPVVDATAAGGQRLANPDAGAAKITTPAASPASYFELTFQAEAGVPYHLWIRGKAEKNFWGNDSIYVQFSGSVAPNGTAVSRIGTTTAQTLSIENGINAGLSGWGWNDDAYEGLAAPIYFATTGPQTVRVQVREDGISIDQLVLSADAYAAAAPGAAKNDTTILQK